MAEHIVVAKALTPKTADTPLDVRQRVSSVSDIRDIPLAWVGMMVYVTGEDKYYRVTSLRDRIVGASSIPDYYPNTWEELSSAIAPSLEGDFLSKTEEDVAQEVIAFLKGIVIGANNTYGINKDGVATLAGMHSPNNDNSMISGHGWEIDADGNLHVNSVEVRSSLKTMELVMNRLTAQESDMVFTESGLITDITAAGSGFLCTLEKRSDNDFHAFQVGDIVRGVVNNLASRQQIGTYYTGWYRVSWIDTTQNQVRLTKYGASDCPDGANYDPVKKMVIHRWGNDIVANAANHAEYPSVIVEESGAYRNIRQSCWYISSMEKRIVMLDHVNAPKITNDNYALFVGLPANFVNGAFKGHTLNPNQPYIYSRGAFLQDIHFIDYKGDTFKVERPRGDWSATTAVSDPYVVNDSTFDTVYHNNAKWECLTTNTLEEPTSLSSAWRRTMKGGDDAVFYRLIPSATTIMRDNTGTPRVNYVSCIVQKCEGSTVTTETPTNLYYSINGGNVVQGSFVSLAKDDGIESVEFMLMPQTAGAVGMALGEAVLDSPLTKVTVSIIQEPKDGENIPLRLSMWNNSATYHSGNNGEVIQDIVTVDGVTNEMYICKYTHSGVKPSADTCANNNWDATHPWAATEYREFMATKVFFANRALIDNLSITGTITEECEMVDMTEKVHIIGGEIQDGKATKISSLYLDLWNTGGSGQSNRTIGHIVQLPTYNGYSNSDFSFGAKAYQVAGTRMSIFTSPSNAVLNWMEMEQSDYASLSDYATDLIEVVQRAVLVCADPLALIGEAHVDGATKVIRPKHTWGGGSSPYSGEYKHGRFAFNGKTARLLLLYPGQHLDLISQIQTIDGEQCLVWNICNTSDFATAGISLGADGTALSAFVTDGFTLAEGTFSSKTHFSSGSGASGLDGFIADLMPFDTRKTSSPDSPLIDIAIGLAGKFTATGLTNVSIDLPSWTADVI